VVLLLLSLLVAHGLLSAFERSVLGQGTTTDAEVLARASAFLEKADARSALALLEKASRTAGDDARTRADVLRLKGYTLVLLRRDAEAEATFRELLRLVPDDEYGTLELAKRLHAQCAFAEARRLYTRVLDRDPDHAGARQGLKSLERDERDHEAVAERVRSGDRALLRLAGLTLIVLVAYGLVLRYLLFKRVPAE
jgi:tetratricopeptide (TPR) repeat protein